MRNRLLLVLLAGTLAMWAGTRALGATAASAPAKAASAPTAAPRALSFSNQPMVGDFDQMLERRVIRVLVPFSRSLYYIDQGHERGLTAELVRDFERWINKTYKQRLGKRPLTVILIPTTRDKLLSGVAGGLGDIAAGNITVTAARNKIVDFAAPPDASNVNEIVATGPGAPALASLDDLAGKTVHVRPSSSYYESLQTLNKRLVAAGKPRVVIVPLPDALEDEDKLEMLNAGLLKIVVVDDWKARLWAPTLPKIKLHENLVLREDGRVGWAFRFNSPQLAAALNQFYTGEVKKQGSINYRMAQMNKRIKQIRNNAGSRELQRFDQTIELFRKYGEKYDFDPLMLAAQGYQESQLRQDAKSHVGAIGVMQIMPATGKGLAVGNIGQIEPNIHGGAKYMDQLMTRYFKDANFTGNNRPLFAFAAYNAGPGNIAKMRKLAAERGLDPDKWFNNVEIVTAEKIGIETTTYVRNIFKYYTSYKLLADAHAEQRRAIDAIEGASAPKR